MSKPEDTPIVINFKSSKIASTYGTTALAPLSTPTSDLTSTSTISHLNNNNGSSHSDVRPAPSVVYCLYGQSHVELRDHCHRQRSEGVDVRARKKLIFASVLCLFFMICEIIGGVLSNSLAIATDAAHLLTDLASFMISLFAIWIAGRPSTKRMSFGWYRAEVIGAMASVIMIWVITAILVWLAVQRVIHGDFEVDSVIMLITSGLAILVNLIMGIQLQHGHSHGGMSSSGHSHGSDKKLVKTIKGAKDKNQKPTTEPTDLAVRNDARKMTTQTENQIDVAVYPASHAVNEPAGQTFMEAVDAEMPAAGLSTFSYQNSKSVNEVKAEMAAVMAETAPGGHHHGGQVGKDVININVRAAFIHVVGDMIQSVGVFVAALIIFFRPDWVIVDPICTFIFSIIVLFTTFAIMKDALLVLMEGTPSYMHYNEVRNIFQNIEGVEQVHNLRIWALSINKIALSVHLAIAPNADPKLILDRATTAVHMRYNFFETTIQIEDVTPNMENCKQCNEPDLLH